MGRDSKSRGRSPWVPILFVIVGMGVSAVSFRKLFVQSSASELPLNTARMAPVPALGVRSPSYDSRASIPSFNGSSLKRVPVPVLNALQRWLTNTDDQEYLSSLLNIVRESPISGEQCADLASVVGFIRQGSKISDIASIAIEKCSRDLGRLQRPSASAKPIIDKLWTLHEPLFASRDFSTDQRLFDLLLPWETRGSGHSQWAKYIYAELLQNQGRTDDAYIEFKDLVEERQIAFEPSDGVNRPLDFELGASLFLMDRLSEAEPHLRQAAIDHKYGDAGDVLTMLVIDLVRQNKFDDAAKYMQQYYARKCTSVIETQMLIEYQARRDANAKRS